MSTTSKISMAASLLIAIWCSAALASPIMYVDDSSGNLGKVDVATGHVNLIGNMGHVMTDIAFDPSGNLYGVTFTGFYSINASTGASTYIGSLGTTTSANALVFGTNGTAYAASNTDTGLYTINTSTGHATSLGSTGHDSGGDLAFNNGSLYLADAQNQLVKIDLSNLANTSVVGSFGVSNVYGLATADTGQMYGVAGSSIYEVSTSTGAATNGVSFAGQGLSSAYGQSFYTEAGAKPVPEPSSVALLLIGAMLLGVGARRRQIAASIHR